MFGDEYLYLEEQLIGIDEDTVLLEKANQKNKIISALRRAIPKLKNIKGIKGISFNTNPANDNIAIIQLMQQQHDQIHRDIVQQHIQDVLDNQMNLDSLSNQLQMDTINANNIAISMAHPMPM